MAVVLNNLINTTRCGKLLNSDMTTSSFFNLNCVKRSLTRGQSAWVNRPSETQRSAFSSGRAVSNKENLKKWLVGLTDGDGTFYIGKQKNGLWNYSFQISQSSSNLRLLHFIKASLRVGSITVDSKNSMAVYRVRNRKHIIKHILPIFDAHPLLTSKHFKYTCFRESILLSENSSMSTEKKDSLISNLKLKSKRIPKNYRSPVWKAVSNLLETKQEAELVITKSWLVGFTEAEGSFYLTLNGPHRLAHVFEITQKLDLTVLKAIALILNGRIVSKKTCNTVIISDPESLQIVINYFFKTMKGMKSLEYRIWARSFAKRKKGFEYLFKIRELMSKIQFIR